jgi:antitoxin (DNA-binding transcriptional repressor) of toxin-antitoxin stability system
MSVRELNASVSRAIALVESGETIDITKHGRVVAEIRPKRPARDAEWFAARDRLLKLMKAGLPLGGKATYEDRYGDADL